ncbi:malonyl-[acyl-carrier protein] O-methyltransferase-like protein [Dinothrombium tinctorium]|uniref:Malonyl-[acyl-carrier protein] O-methyltransferase-like protein n=1 Tax=Dinothrombium tinctorium TaxID=1965070 RepID=A0A443QNX6_9ACAR|nr:malonyl-[acyl-carrier protein] O-methyltransferase-like protein [Dinothrombium tinctorium]
MSNQFAKINNFIEDILYVDRSVEETMKIYSEWARNYNEHAEHGQFINMPKLLAREFGKLNLPKNVRILDVGAGTGLLGTFLHEIGYENIDALDGSQEMLDRAKSLNGVYRNFINALVKVGQRLPIEDKTYDVALMSAVVCPSHISVEAYGEIVRIVKSGGVIGWIKRVNEAFSKNSNEYRNGAYENLLKKYEINGLWTPINSYCPAVIENLMAGTNGEIYFMRVI